MVHLYFLVAPRLRRKCGYASGGLVLAQPLLPLGVALAGVALFAVQVCAADDGAGAEGFCVGEGHCFTLPISAAALTMARRVAARRLTPWPSRIPHSVPLGVVKATTVSCSPKSISISTSIERASRSASPSS